jgi:hypothetical protein
MKVQKKEDACLPSTEESLTLNNVWAIFRETDKKIQETERLLRHSKEMVIDLKQKCDKIIERIDILNFTPDYRDRTDGIKIRE